MILFMLTICVLVFAALITVTSIVPEHSAMSLFEMKRRSQGGDSGADELMRREQLLGDVVSLQRALQALLLVIFVAISVVALGWFFGIVIAVVIALEYGAVARLSFVHNWSQAKYERHEHSILQFVEKYPVVFKFLRSVTSRPIQAKQLDSREELLHMLDQSGALLTVDEKKLMTHSMQFGSRRVSEVMTPRGVIDSVKATEMLGPLVLDSLHKTGHSRFPVIDGDIDHVVGMLYVQNLLTLDSKASTTTASKAMERRVFYIKEDQSLQHALAAFIRTHHHLFVVVNEFRETVGLLSLEDVMEALLGHKIIDEFDAHDDLRVVATRNPRGNNRPEKREDV